MNRFLIISMLCFVGLGQPGCGKSDDSPSSSSGDAGAASSPSGAPMGSCRSAGSATGSPKADCHACAKSKCSAEFTLSHGSGWAGGNQGGDGPCRAFLACQCECRAQAGKSPLACLTGCASSQDEACLDAQTESIRCQSDKCKDNCR